MRTSCEPIRNRWAHFQHFDDADTFRALDTAEGLARGVGGDHVADRIAALEIMPLRRMATAGIAAAQVDAVPVAQGDADAEVRPQVPVDASSTMRSPRRLETFLDAMLAYASDSHSYLLDRTYNDGLTADERMLRDRLLSLVDDLPPAAKPSTSWRVLQSALQELGLGSEDKNRPASGSHRSADGRH